MEMPRIPTWDGRTAKSAGITSATLPQGKIVQMAQLDQLVLQRLRARPVEPDGRGRRLPVGSLEDHHALQGELFFAEVVPDHEATAGISGAIHITGFTSFNGRDCEREAIRFLGVVLKPAYLGQGKVVDITYQAAGTQTVVNTGDDPIPEGSLVYWAAPTVNWDRGVPLAGHDQSGKPATKFVPALRALKIRDISSRWLAFHFEVSQLMEKNNAAKVEEVDRIADNYAMMHGDLAHDPYRRAGRVLWSNFTGKDVRGHYTSGNAKVVPLYQDLSMQHMAHLSGSRSSDPNFDNDEPKTFANSAFTALALSVIFCDLINLYYSRVVGKALSSASKGEQFDLLIRAGL